jgi:hypothetical protein
MAMGYRLTVYTVGWQDAVDGKQRRRWISTLGVGYMAGTGRRGTEIDVTPVELKATQTGQDRQDERRNFTVLLWYQG